MKKGKIAVVILAGLLIFVLGLSAGAASAAATPQRHTMTLNERLEIGAGLAFNYLDLSDVRDGETIPLSENLSDLRMGSGFYLNANYWITPFFGLQAGYDYSAANATYEGVSFVEQHNKLSGGFIGIAGRWGGNLKLHLSLGRYEMVETTTVAGISGTATFEGPAVMTGIQLSAPINSSISVHGTADLRIAGVSKKPENSAFDPQNYTNVSGFRLGAGLDLRF